MNHAQFWGGGGAAPYEIEQSLRFDGSSYLSRTFSSAGNRKTFTVSWWVKRATGNSLTYRDDYMFSAYDGGGSGFQLKFTGTELADGVTEFSNDQGYSGSPSGYSYTNNKYRDESAWYHIVYVADYSNATAADRRRIYFNGERVTNFRQEGTYSNADSSWNYAGVHYIGRYVTTTSYNFHGYMAEVNVIDGQDLLPTDFGEYDDNGVWRPKLYTGTYGTNGVYLKFDPSATNGIGHDHSGNGNHWTPTNFTTSGTTELDVLSDTPTNNYCTWNPLFKQGGSPSYSQGNLNVSGDPASPILGTIGVSSGKWYWEVQPSFASALIGICGPVLSSYSGNLYDQSTGYCYGHDGRKGNNGSLSSYGSSYSGGDIIGVALDLDAGTLVFYKNGTSQGTAFTGLSGTFFPAISDWGTNANFTLNCGQRAFEQTVPSGYKALNTSNLPAPDIADGSDYFNTKLYTGDGSTDNPITGVGFQPDFVWIKERNDNGSHQLYDAVRGATKRLESDNTTTETTFTNGLKSFDTDGFSLGNYSNGNQLNITHASWNWLAANGTTTPTQGTIASTASVNQTAGFSIVSYTGTGTAGTVGHGLSVAPSMVIVKSRTYTNTSWCVSHSGYPTTQTLYLDDTTGVLTRDRITARGASTFSIGTHFEVNDLDDTYIAYCFAEVEGYSKFGYVSGLNNDEFVYLGFSPAWIMFKRTSTTSNWAIRDSKRDTYNISSKEINADTPNAESTFAALDFLSNGFKARSFTGVSGGWIYAAFSENPFGGSGVSPATAR